MAAGMAKTQIIGNLGADPEVKFTASGTPVCNMRVAVTTREKKGTEWADETTWYGVVAFGKLGELCGQHLAKGRQVYADGKLRINEWTNKAGEKKTTPEIIASDVVFLGKKEGGEGATPPAKTTSSSKNDDADSIPF